jgi:hypothetical protein
MISGTGTSSGRVSLAVITSEETSCADDFILHVSVVPLFIAPCFLQLGPHAVGTELDRVLDLPESPKLLELDNTLRLYISIMSRYHGESSRGLTSKTLSDKFPIFSCT